MRFAALCFLDFSFASYVNPSYIQEEMILPVGYGSDGFPRFYTSPIFVGQTTPLQPSETEPSVELKFESRTKRHPQHNPMSPGDYYFRILDTSREFQVNFIGSQMRLMNWNLGFDNKVSVGFGSAFLEIARKFLWLPTPSVILMPQNPSEYCYGGAIAMIGGQVSPKITVPATVAGLANQVVRFNVDFGSDKILLPQEIFSGFVGRILDIMGSQRRVADVMNLESWFIPSALCSENVLRSFPALALAVENHLTNPTSASAQTMIYPEDYTRIVDNECEILIGLADTTNGPTLGMPFISHVALYLDQDTAQLGFCEPI